jgi:hypothetical protein
MKRAGMLITNQKENSIMNFSQTLLKNDLQMEKSVLGSFLIALVILLFLNLFITGQVKAQSDSKTLKIGVYDSRIIVFAYSRSKLFQDHLARLKQETDSAITTHDTIKFKEISIRSMSYQHWLHQMVFGTGSVSDIMSLIKEKLPQIAQKNGVSLIVSKYELPFKSNSVEVVDLTKSLAQLFGPNEDIWVMAGQIEKATPVPMEELSIEQEMLDSYVIRFGKK